MGAKGIMSDNLQIYRGSYATAGGGSLFGEVGQIREGYRFNALVIDGLEDEGVKHTVSELLERFCYIGDDRNITKRFLDGSEILL